MQALTPAPCDWLDTDLQENAGAFSFSAALAVIGPDQVRFQPHLSFGFPATDVYQARQEDDGWHLTLNLPGLYGSHSPLPTSYTEDLFFEERTESGNPLRRGLFDMVHNQLYHLFAAVLTHRRDPLRQTHLLRLFTGLAERTFNGSIPGNSLLAWAGLLGGRCRGSDSLERLLSGWTNLPCQVEECIPLWTLVPDEHRTVLGKANCSLGNNCLTGEWFVSRATAFRVTIGPVSWLQLEPWLLGGKELTDVVALIEVMNGDALDVEIVLKIATSDLPCLPLGQGKLGRQVRTNGLSAAEHCTVVYRTTDNR